MDIVKFSDVKKAVEVHRSFCHIQAPHLKSTNTRLNIIERRESFGDIFLV